MSHKKWKLVDLKSSLSISSTCTCSKAGIIQSTVQSQWFCWQGTLFLHFLLHTDWCFKILALQCIFKKLMLDLGAHSLGLMSSYLTQISRQEAAHFLTTSFWGSSRIDRAIKTSSICPSITFSAISLSTDNMFLST